MTPAASTATYRTTAVDVRGGTLHTALWGPDNPAALPVVVVGHSMGAFAAVVLANLFPDRVRSLVLVDGGLPLQVPAGLTDAEIVAAVLGPAADGSMPPSPAGRPTARSGSSTRPSARTGARWWRTTWTMT